MYSATGGRKTLSRPPTRHGKPVLPLTLLLGAPGESTEGHRRDQGIWQAPHHRRIPVEKDVFRAEASRVFGDPHQIGWFIWVGEGDRDNLPADLVGITEYARRLGAEYILFDRDAPEDEALARFLGRADALPGSRRARPGGE